MINKTYKIITINGVVIETDSIAIALSFWYDGALVEYIDSKWNSTFNELIVQRKDSSELNYPVLLNENEINNLVSHWEKTGLFGSIIIKIRFIERIMGMK